ncbi:hypothetical protein Tco_0116267 [Tanacetum coccineum]
MDTGSSSKIDISLSLKERMTDQTESSNKNEESFSFRPHSEKTILKEKKIMCDIPIPQTFPAQQMVIMKELYNLSGTDYKYVDFSGVYPRINYLQGSSPQEKRYWYDFGAINSIYLTSLNFLEISQLPFWVGDGIKDCYLKNPTITPKDILVLKFLSVGPDFYEEKRYPIYHFMQLRKADSFSISFPTQRKDFQRYCQNDIHFRRAVGIRTDIQGMEASFKRGFRTYSGKKKLSSIMISPAKITPNAARNFTQDMINFLDTGLIKSSPYAQNKICRYRQHERGTCSACSPLNETEE